MLSQLLTLTSNPKEVQLLCIQYLGQTQWAWQILILSPPIHRLSPNNSKLLITGLKSKLALLIYSVFTAWIQERYLKTETASHCPPLQLLSLF